MNNGNIAYRELETFVFKGCSALCRYFLHIPTCSRLPGRTCDCFVFKVNLKILFCESSCLRSATYRSDKIILVCISIQACFYCPISAVSKNIFDFGIKILRHFFNHTEHPLYHVHCPE